MNIKKVTNAIYIGDFFKRNDIKSNLGIKYNDSLSKSDLKDDAGRVYLLVVNEEIKKIGGSQCKGGIKTTMGSYLSGNTGRPSTRTFGINYLIEKHLSDGDKVKVYMINSEQVKTSVSGLFEKSEMLISAFKEMEDKCKEDYKKIENKYPDWNYKESDRPWENNIQIAHSNFISESSGKSK